MSSTRNTKASKSVAATLQKHLLTTQIVYRQTEWDIVACVTVFSAMIEFLIANAIILKVRLCCSLMVSTGLTRLKDVTTARVCLSPSHCSCTNHCPYLAPILLCPKGIYGGRTERSALRHFLTYVCSHLGISDLFSHDCRPTTEKQPTRMGRILEHHEGAYPHGLE